MSRQKTDAQKNYANRGSRLDPRKAEICSLIEQGLGPKRMAEELDVPIPTLYDWIIKKKDKRDLDVLSAVEAARRMLERRSKDRERKAEEKRLEKERKRKLKAEKKPKTTQTPQTPGMKVFDIMEARGLKEFGISLDEKSWGNRIWMKANGYELNPTKRYDGKGPGRK